MSKKKKINKSSNTHPHKRDKKNSKKDHETFIVGEELTGIIDIARSGDAFVSIEGKNKDFFIAKIEKYYQSLEINGFHAANKG